MGRKDLLFAGLCLAGLAALGASLFRFESSRPVQASAMPPAARESFAATTARLDEHFRHTWREQNLHPAPRASDLALARRLSLALEGTIPALEEIRQLEAQPPERRLSWWLDQIFADRRSADYLAERLARPLVGVDDGPVLLYRRRRFVSWLSDQIARDRPYDDLIRKVVSSEGLWTDQPATNFITATLQGSQDSTPDVNVLASRVTRTLLGIRLDCAECHDHPFDPRWQQADFQALAAFFAQARMSATGIRDTGGPYRAVDHATQQERIVPAAVPFQEELLPRTGGNRQRLAHWITHPENKAFARATVNRVWTLMLSRPLTDVVDDIPTDEHLPEPLEILADDFAANGFRLQRLIRLIAASEAFQRDSRADPEMPGHEITAVHDSAWAAFPLARLRSEQVVGGILQAASLTALDHDAHILVRVAKAIGEKEFIERYGDAGTMELDASAGTIPQRLILLNGKLVQEKLDDNLVGNAATRIAALAPDDDTAIEVAYLATLTRRPTPEETTHFRERLKGAKGRQRSQRLGDLYWTLINSTEFAWNH